MMSKLAAAGMGALAAVLSTGPANAADLIISMNDNHTVLDSGANQVAASPVRPDTADIIDIGQSPPRIVQTFEVPGSVVGPPFAVWVAAHFSWAILTAANKADGSTKSGVSPDNRVSVVDLTTTPPHITQTLTAGAGATTVRLSPDGTLALVANRVEGSVSVFTVRDKRLTPAGKVEFGKQAGPSSIVFSQDGRTALVTRHMDNQISVLHIDGTAITVDPRPVTTALSPFTMDITPDHTIAAVTNVGRNDGDIDSVSLIDLTKSPPVAVSITGVPSGPEPLKFSPDGKFLAVGAQLGTQLTPGERFYHEHGLLQVFSLDGTVLAAVAAAPVGRWVEGIAWSRDGGTILVQNDRDRTISVFGFDGHTLTAKPDLIPTGGPAAFGTAWP